MGIAVLTALGFGFVTAWIGRSKGSSFFIWFLVGASLGAFGGPYGGVIAVVVVALYRVEKLEPERQCPRCGKVLKLYVQVCTRCGEDLYLPDPPDATA